jgi:Ras-related protein Rab-5C
MQTVLLLSMTSHKR